MWGSVFSVCPLPLWWLGEYISFVSYYLHQIGGMNYYPLFRVSSWNNGMRCMSFYILSNYVIEFEGLYVSFKQNPSCEHVSKIHVLSFVFFCPMLQRKSRSQVLSAIRSNIGLSPSYSKGQDPAACILMFPTVAVLQFNVCSWWVFVTLAHLKTCECVIKRALEVNSFYSADYYCHGQLVSFIHPSRRKQF